MGTWQCMFKKKINNIITNNLSYYYFSHYYCNNLGPIVKFDLSLVKHLKIGDSKYVYIYTISHSKGHDAKWNIIQKILTMLFIHYIGVYVYRSRVCMYIAEICISLGITDYSQLPYDKYLSTSTAKYDL